MCASYDIVPVPLTENIFSALNHEESHYKDLPHLHFSLNQLQIIYTDNENVLMD